MTEKIQYVLEYSFNCPPKVLFNRLSTPGGLSEWFADDVNMIGNLYSFIWNGNKEDAEIVSQKDLKFIKFHWVEDDDSDTFFEFRINIEELSGDAALIITDFAEEDELEGAKELWNSQIAELKRILGI